MNFIRTIKRRFASSLAIALIVFCIAPAPAFAVIPIAGILVATAIGGALVGLSSVVPGLNPVSLYETAFCSDTNNPGAYCPVKVAISPQSKPEIPSGWGADPSGNLLPPSTVSVNKTFFKSGVTYLMTPMNTVFTPSIGSCRVNQPQYLDDMTSNSSCVSATNGRLYIRQDFCSSTQEVQFFGTLTSAANSSTNAFRITTSGANPATSSTSCGIAFPYGAIYAISNDVSCPSGYINSSGTCTLSDSTQVKRPSNGQCRVIKVNGSYAVDPNDSDCADTAILNKFTLAPDTVRFSDGANYSSSISKDNKGHVTIIQSTFDPNTNSTTSTIVTGLENGDGSVSVVSNSASVSQGRNLDTSAAASANNAAASDKAAAAAGVVVGGSSSQTPPFQMPCGVDGTNPCKVDPGGDASPDYVVPQQVKDAETSGLDWISFKGLFPDPNDTNFVPDTSNNLGNHHFDPPSFYEWARLGNDGCFNPPAFTFSFMNTQYQIDGCRYWQPVKPSVAYLFSILTCFYCLSLFFNAGGSEGDKK